MRDTLHGSRPNLRQRDPDGRIVPTPPLASWTNVRARRNVSEEEKKYNFTYTTYNVQFRFFWGAGGRYWETQARQSSPDSCSVRAVSWLTGSRRLAISWVGVTRNYER